MSAPLAATTRVERDGFVLDVDLRVEPGELVAVVGPNGSGKSTLLAALAGLVPLSSGRITSGARILSDTRSGIQVATPQRRAGLLFQDYLLFPHLSVLDNVAFGPRSAGVHRRDARTRAMKWLETLGIPGLAQRRPASLSGGQAQRVALARTLAAEPEFLLLDEPLAALDAGTRLSVRTELGRHVREYGAPALLVTHDPVDALVLGDRLIVLEGGRIAQEGSPADVARRPRTEYVARLVGRNLYRGNASEGTVQLPGGGRLSIADHVPSGDVLLSVRPSSVVVSRIPVAASTRNAWAGRVIGIEPIGDRVRLEIDGIPRVLADVTPEAVASLGLASGQDVFVSVKATDIDVYAESNPPV